MGPGVDWVDWKDTEEFLTRMLTLDHVINSIFDSTTWLLSDTDEDLVWLVDCGDWNCLKNRIGGRRIEGVLLTHAHFDHIYGLPQLLEQYPDCKIFTNEVGRFTMASDRLNLSKYHGNSVVVDESRVCVCMEGDAVSLFKDTVAAVFETPGHHPSCLAYIVNNYMFTGDAYIPGMKVVTNLPGSDKVRAAESVERILRLAEGKAICPGHGAIITTKQ